jgi:D-glycero-alpha-D-manno-heptose 1-phosphate guanylyltransferase
VDKSMEAIILAGGFGTRLKSVIADIPKPMAPVQGKPFLEYLLEYLNTAGIGRVILSVGYKYEVIEEYFGDRYKDVSLAYSIEDSPLGTGGAIKKSFEMAESEELLILNGDTFFKVSLNEFYQHHKECDAHMTLSLKPMRDFERYGTVETRDGRIVRFIEKQYRESGDINAGVYFAKKGLFDGFNLSEAFSFETDFLEKYLDTLMVYSYGEDSYFIDIGIPEDYERAQKELADVI